MPDRFTVLLDQNIPKSVASWLIRLKPSWTVYHASELELSGKSDEEVFAWAQRNAALIGVIEEASREERRDRPSFIMNEQVCSRKRSNSDEHLVFLLRTYGIALSKEL